MFKTAGRKAAYAASNSPAFAAEVAKVEAAVKAAAARHSHSTTFERSIKTERGRVDHYIISTDKLAFHKEFGHFSGNKRHWVRGIFVFTNVAKALGR